MTSQKLCEHVGRIASCTNREAYEWRGSTVAYFQSRYVQAVIFQPRFRFHYQKTRKQLLTIFFDNFLSVPKTRIDTDLFG